jgi:hypothetical protein
MTGKNNIPPAVFAMHRRQFMMTAAAGALAAGVLPGHAFAQDAATEIVPATPLADLPREAGTIWNKYTQVDERFASRGSTLNPRPSVVHPPARAMLRAAVRQTHDATTAAYASHLADARAQLERSSSGPSALPAVAPANFFTLINDQATSIPISRGFIFKNPGTAGETWLVFKNNQELLTIL